MLTNTEFALSLESAAIQAACAPPTGPTSAGLSIEKPMPVVGPTGSVTQQAEMKVPLAFRAGRSDAKVDAGIAVYSTAAALFRTAWAKAALSPCGVPSLLRMSVFQPTEVAACLTMSPSSVHSVLPHGMKSTVRPLGMGLVTFTVSVMAVGSWISLVTMACALARPAWSAALRPLAEVELELEEAAPELLELLEPQAASDKEAATASSTPTC